MKEAVYRTLSSLSTLLGASGSVRVKALYYKPQGRGLETRWVNEFLEFT
jgi:hypothetical protein